MTNDEEKDIRIAESGLVIYDQATLLLQVGRVSDGHDQDTLTYLRNRVEDSMRVEVLKLIGELFPLKDAMKWLQ